jgi:uncharacterized protein (DUF983 family)
MTRDDVSLDDASDTGASGKAPENVRALWRGFMGRCPKCGEGRLLHRYLKVHPTCANCGEAFAHFNADDMPPWLTILIVGHLLFPEVWYVQRNYNLPVWSEQVLWVSLALILTLTLLPRCKGFVLALFWIIQRSDAQKAARIQAPGEARSAKSAAGNS